MAEQLSNSAASTLSAGIDNIVTSLTVANGTPFPASGNFRVLIDSELILVGARSGNTLSSLTRGVEATTAASHSSGAAATHILTKLGLTNFIAENSIAQTIADAKGDLIAGTAADTLSRLAVGADKTVLMADSTQATGLGWGGAWAAYTPVWASSGTQPAVGNGSISGKYAQVGKIVHYWISQTMGSTTTYGTGNYTWSLPVNSTGQGVPHGTARGVDTSVLDYTGMIIISTVNSVQVVSASNGLPWSPTVPFTWGNTDLFYTFGTYEAS